MKIAWTPPGHSDMLQRADGARYKTGTGHRGTYEWVVKDGLWAAYYYPGRVQTDRTRVTLLDPTPRAAARTYDACVEHNKNLQGITGGESGPMTMRRKPTTAVCPECHEAHTGQCM